ncbi:MazG nucleotide pyrophosphohydrolase domain-containing protein [Alkalicoccobacillus porphyridii]|uniref:Nucleotide pyrophosphohydrolase n=1 Tax=Alkalicoccobacillus porphyridii TaxID=2597270 RepID=A0A554A0J8_9BACI|nr:MazG nucleotide pyrophosphohydrolase domain-containing protein [Alkalicoccobacillus porphyridii]TSB47224.1 nucleotide pyrophosphohydrolase [Alkalicoccobacillus porphyridii]
MSYTSLQTIRDYQELVDQSIRHLGGYWRTLSGMARVTEEIGELAELLLVEEANDEDVGGELADVFIITTCLANQFACDLTSEYKKLGLSTEVQYIIHEQNDLPTAVNFQRLVQTTGQLARLLNHYDGDKKLKVTEKQMSVCSVIALVHQQLYTFAASLHTNVFDHVERTLKKNLERDRHRFALTSDPITEPTVERYLQLKTHSSSVFQQGSRYWGAKPWDVTQTLQENMERFSGSLRRFTVCSRIEGLDGFIIEAPKQALTQVELQTYVDSASLKITQVESRETVYFLLRVE